MAKWSPAGEQSTMTAMTRAMSLCAICVLALLPDTGRADYGDALDTRGGGIAARYVQHARAALSHEHVTEALAFSQRALDLLPNYAFASYTHGQASMAGAHYDDAIADFTHVIAQHPEYPGVYAIRALAYLRARKAGQAVADLNHALTTPVGMHDELAATVFFYRSLAWQLMGQDNAAIADFQRGLEPLIGKLDNYNALALTCYTATLIDLLQTAQMTCDESISRSGRNILAYEARGLLDLKQHAWDKAIADNTQSLYYRADQPMALYGRAIARRARGDSAGAAADMQAARDIEPDIAQIMARVGIKIAA
jgi:tetratricopeptide (TPR) repeat protein